ncbi:MAG: hypothetical protein AB8A40_00670 [Prochlorococcus sp.]
MARKPRQIPLRWLHGVSRLMLQGQRQERLARSSQALQARRSRQRQHLARQIVEMPLEGWLWPQPSGGWLWRSLRWGGPALALGWWLSQR